MNRKGNIKKIFAFLAAIAVLATAIPFNGIISQAAAKKASKITLSKSSATMLAGSSLKLKVKKVSPAGASKAVTWKTSNKKRAIVTAGGVVKAKKAGTVRITAVSKVNPKAKASCKITIYNKTKKLQLISSKNYTLSVGVSMQLEARVTSPASRTQPVRWTSSNADVASISKTGLVKAVSKGTAKMTAKSGGKSVSVNITVEDTEIPAAGYIVTFDTAGGSAVASQSVAGGSTAVKPADPVREGYTFGGWYTDSTLTAAYDFASPVTGNLTLYAKWDTASSVTYKVVFQTNGGNAITEQTVRTGEKVTKPDDPVKFGFEFAGWYSDSFLKQAYDFDAAVTKNITLYARWRDTGNGSAGGSTYVPSTNPSPSPSPSPTVYTVTFDSRGGSAVASQDVEKDGKVAQPEDPTRAGYTFDGWYTEANDGQKFDFNTAVIGNITLYAHWIASGGDNENYRITFDLNDGSSGVYQVQTLRAGATVTRPSEPMRNRYRFTGWYTEPAALTEYDFGAPVVSDLTIYAGWGNPDGSNELYAASEETDTIYSITGIEVIGNNVRVTYNTNSECLLAVEFFEDQMSGSDWSEEAQADNLSGTPIATASGYTEDYGEMIAMTLPIDGTLPENFVVRATLFGTGEEEDPTYVSNQYTAVYKQFEAQTVDSVIEEYGEDQVINFDSDRTTNFGVLKESVKVIPAGTLVNGFEVTDIDVAGEAVPDHNFIFTNADAAVQNLEAGDVIYLEGTTWLFKIKTISNDAGTITMTQDKDAIMTDFYDVLQVDMGAADTNADAASIHSNRANMQPESTNEAQEAAVSGDDGISPQWEVIDVDASLSASFNPSISKRFENGVTLAGSISGKITGKVKMSYDAHLFSKDYFECSVSFVTEVSSEVKASMSRNNTNEWKNVVYQFDTRGIKLPTPITGLDVYAKPSAKLDWSLSGSVSIKAVTKQTSGFNYNSDTGRTDIKKKENSVSLMAEGRAEVKIGPNIDIGVELLGGVLNAGVTAEAGAKFTATAQTGADDFTNTVDSKHACGLCVSGKAQWYATAAVKCGYKITDRIKGDIAKVTILDFTAPIYFVPNIPAEFFVSVINSADSPFGGHIKFGGGSCTNKTYRTEVQVLDENNQQVNGVQVSVIKQGQASGSSGTSPYVSYLYEGTYKASASFDGTNVSKTFVVSKNRQTVTLTLLSADSILEGTIVDANNNSAAIGGASIKVSKDGVVVASAESNSNGEFSVAVPDGSLKVDISKDGYLPFTSMETVYDSEHHSMGLVRLTPGTGMGGFRGVIRDATDNSPLSNVELKLYKGWNSDGEANTAIRTLTTNNNGEFRYDTITVFGKVIGLPSGNYTLRASKDGYSDTSYNIVIYPGTTDENPSINETMSPSMNEGYYRVILTWGSTPSDLDSHLVADTDTGSDIHVYYGDKEPSPGYANLDRDDVDSYGPETITITNFEGLKNIRYAIHDYTNRSSSSSTAMAHSDATVRVFKGNHLLRTFQVPTGYDGTEWDVFSLGLDGRISTINSMTYTDDPTGVLGNGDASRMVSEPAPLKDYEVTETVE